MEHRDELVSPMSEVLSVAVDHYSGVTGSMNPVIWFSSASRSTFCHATFSTLMDSNFTQSRRFQALTSNLTGSLLYSKKRRYLCSHQNVQTQDGHAMRQWRMVS